MPDRIFSVFDSYDAYGKSLPGMALLIGVGFLLPSGSVGNIVIGQSFLNFIAAVISVVLIGSLIGEGVHTVAVAIESIVDYILRKFAGFRNVIYEMLNLDWEILPPERDTHELINRHLAYRIIIGWWDGSRLWVAKRLSAIRFSMLGHRSIYERVMQGGFQNDPNIIRMESVINHARNLARDGYNIDLQENALAFYPIAVSRLSETNFGRSAKFQARYAFCRGMWVNSLVIAILYYLVLHTPVRFMPDSLIYVQNNSMLTSAVTASQIELIIGMLVLTAFVFLNGVYRYKMYNIEYLFVELFLHTSNVDHDEYVHQQQIS